MNQFSNQFSNVVSSLRSVNESLCDWETLKRTPQVLRQKVNSGNSRTIDVTFDELNQQLVRTKLSLNKISKNCKFFSSTTSILLETLENINNHLLKLTNQNTNSYLKMVPEMIPWETSLAIKIPIYQKTIYSIKDSVSEQLKLLNLGIDAKISQIGTMIYQIDKKITQRLNCLVTYDDAYNEHEQLYLKERSGEILATKKSQRLMLLERKLEDLKFKYESINELLKKELKVFFTLMDCFVYELKSEIYYVHLLVIYQFQSHIESFAQGNELVVPVGEYLVKAIFPFLKTLSGSTIELVDNLGIVKLRDRYLEDLVIDNPHKDQFCEALFDFKNIRSDELSFKKHDKIRILEKELLWWKGELNGEIGYFPSNHVQEI